MRVAQLGSGTPEFAVVAGIHGDEPGGVRAVERLLEQRPAVERPVKLIVANEEALERQVRYVEEDLNRAFPGDPDAETLEGRLAHELANELEGCLTFSLHSTQSHAEPFAIVNGVTEMARGIVPQLPVKSMVEAGPFVEGRLFTVVDAIEVECGLQGSETAAENAYSLTRSFLTAVDALPGDTVCRELPIYQLVDVILKDGADTYEVFVENFERVDRGDPFAAADGEPQVASEPFYPVLMSSNGYQDVFGYAAEKLETLSSGTAAD
ncbi:succinylglutamate desuccinylase/aspartoacylase family protein [Natrialbaceae archaeon GCM10025810]|uniref:succinylglutamate desuccinylase/aspartoacylase domain-containing protein n=1 Tax=Halovalidus salilacus TaxID=3075124 RepID=UPI0036112605